MFAGFAGVALEVYRIYKDKERKHNQGGLPVSELRRLWELLILQVDGALSKSMPAFDPDAKHLKGAEDMDVNMTMLQLFQAWSEDMNCKRI